MENSTEKKVLKVEKFEVRFEGEYAVWDANFTFSMVPTPGFDYGNKTSVTIDQEGISNPDFKKHSLIDTRYDRTVTVDFEKWCLAWMNENLVAHTAKKIA